jgi:CheY-like chemotaxis protein/CHASE3 domain sensor protein
MAVIDIGGERGARLADLSLRNKLLLAFGSFLALLIVACVMFFLAQQRQKEARGWTTHTYAVLNRIETALRALRERQVAVRGYLLSARESELDLYQSAGDNYNKVAGELLTLTADNPVQQARLVSIHENVTEWRSNVADVAIDSVRIAQNAGSQKQALVEAAGLRYLDGVGGTLKEVYETYDAMRVEEETLLAKRIVALDHATELTTFLIAVVMLLGLAVVAASVIAADRLVTRPVLQLTGLMTRLADHDHDIVVPMQRRRDEIGEIARALEVFKRMAIETYEQSWIKSGVVSISNRLQQAATQRDFGDILVAEAAPLAGAAAAGFHLLDDSSGRLKLLGRYALSGRLDPAVSSTVLGEGLIGQCAVERKPIVITDLPNDYLRISSGLGEAHPRTLVLLPVLLQDRLVGVLELALFGSFENLHQRLFESLLPIVALAMDNLQRAIRTQLLLEETQTQSEELRASEESLRVQQEELRATNDQLIAQRAQLQASEEELKVQAEELQAANEELTEKGETLAQQKKVLEALQQETQARADELARSSQYKTDFLANMSHELRTPLNSLLILSRSLADNDAGHLDSEEVESANIIHESGANLLRLINDILDLSKVEAGKLDLVVDAVDSAEFGQRLGRTFRPVAREKALEFSIEIDPAVPATLHTDGARLEQIANNLIGNAFKFTRKGSVSVRLSRPAADAELPAGLDPASALALSIRDTGIGIPEDKLGRLFQAFEQVDAGTSRQFGGTGLGLAISRRLAQLIGGDIMLESVEGEGSVFTVLFPERSPELAATSPPPPRLAASFSRPSPPAPPTSPTPVAAASPAPAFVPMPIASIADDRDTIQPGDTVILIVEDDPAFARILADLVRRKHYKVLAAADGESGLALAREHKPTGVLLDVMLPGMDGWTVIDKLKADAATRHIPVHFISATDEQARALEAGAVGFLTKPVSRQDVGNAFDRLLHFAPGSLRRVLIVDDDAASRRAVRTLIADDAVEMVDAESAEEALTHLTNGGFDCIVLDLGLPGMSGFEFLERASQNGQVPPVVVHSGRDLSREESLRLRQYTDSIVIKGARSPERLLDEVTLFLHSIRRQTAAATSPPRSVDPTLANRTVLIVDDDMRNIFALSKALRARGLKVLMAQDGQKALKQLADNSEIDIVLMDIMMPGMDGYETTREIRKHPQLRKLPVLALTAKAMQGDREKCLEAGANDYLSKPIDVDKLLSMMRVWVS